MNIYHVTYAPDVKSLQLHFWSCNMDCCACLCKKEIYDCHLEETKDSLFQEGKGHSGEPACFLSFGEVKGILNGVDFSQVIFMGAEPSLDPELPELARSLKRDFKTCNALLTNGLKLVPLDCIDEVVFSIKAFTDEIHRDYTGVSNQEILENFVNVYRSGKKLRSESVFIPDYIGFSEIEKITKFISQVDENIPYRIDAYIPVGDNPWRRPFPWEIEEAVERARRYLLNVSCLKGNEEIKYKVTRLF